LHGAAFRSSRLTTHRGASRRRQTADTFGGRISSKSFYPRFDAVVLLSAPVDVLLRRIDARTTNDYGKTAEERALILSHVAQVEPLLHATCTHEIDATQQLGDVVAQLVEIARGE